MKCYNIFKLIRGFNLLLIAITLILIQFFLFKTFEIQSVLNSCQFTLLLFSVLLISSAGYIVNLGRRFYLSPWAGLSLRVGGDQDITENIVHGSDSPDSAARELGLYFS